MRQRFSFSAVLFLRRRRKHTPLEAISSARFWSSAGLSGTAGDSAITAWPIYLSLSAVEYRFFHISPRKPVGAIFTHEFAGDSANISHIYAAADADASATLAGRLRGRMPLLGAKMLPRGLSPARVLEDGTGWLLASFYHGRMRDTVTSASAITSRAISLPLITTRVAIHRYLS